MIAVKVLGALVLLVSAIVLNYVLRTEVPTEYQVLQEKS